MYASEIIELYLKADKETQRACDVILANCDQVADCNPYSQLDKECFLIGYRIMMRMREQKEKQNA